MPPACPFRRLARHLLHYGQSQAAGSDHQSLGTMVGRRSRGFTLIELVIVLGILAIVISLALPSYASHVRKARRADATSTLLNSAQQLERCFTRFNAYDNEACPSPEGGSAEGFYTITAVVEASTYTLTATPVGAQDADPCGVFTLDHLGNKTPVPGVDRCWGS